MRAIKVRAEVDSKALRKDIGNLLINYSEWLDGEGLIVPADGEAESDNRTHQQLVEDFFVDRSDR